MFVPTMPRYFVQRWRYPPHCQEVRREVVGQAGRSRHATLATRGAPTEKTALGGLERDDRQAGPNLFSTSELADVVGFFLNQQVAAPGGGWWSAMLPAEPHGSLSFSHCGSLAQG